MRLRNTILTHTLLTIYLLVVVDHSVIHVHGKTLDSFTGSSSTHQHEDFHTVHHDHHFHIGIFHFLGHLFESINHAHDLADKYLVVFQKAGTKKVVVSNPSIVAFFEKNDWILYEVDAESLPAPPYHVSLLQKLKLPGTPLRAPPAFV